jgi:hypothetical protein
MFHSFARKATAAARPVKISGVARVSVSVSAKFRPSVAHGAFAARRRAPRAGPGHHDDAVGQRQHLVEILGDQQDRRAALARLEQLRVHIGDGADVEPARRLVGEDDARAPPSSARPRISFCMLPPDSSGCAPPGEGHLTS